MLNSWNLPLPHILVLITINSHLLPLPLPDLQYCDPCENCITVTSCAVLMAWSSLPWPPCIRNLLFSVHDHSHYSVYWGIMLIWSDWKASISIEMLFRNLIAFKHRHADTAVWESKFLPLKKKLLNSEFLHAKTFLKRIRYLSYQVDQLGEYMVDSFFFCSW